MPLGGQCTTTADCVAWTNCSSGICVSDDPLCVADASTATELQAKVKAARSGDTITLAAGNYVFKTYMEYNEGSRLRRRAGLAIFNKSITLQPCPGAPVILTCPAGLEKIPGYLACVAVHGTNEASGVTMNEIDIDSTGIRIEGVFGLTTSASLKGSAITRFSNGAISAGTNVVSSNTPVQSSQTPAANSAEIRFGAGVTLNGPDFGIISVTPRNDSLSTSAVTCKQAVTFDDMGRGCKTSGSGASISKTCGCPGA